MSKSSKLYINEMRQIPLKTEDNEVRHIGEICDHISQRGLDMCWRESRD